MFIRKDEYLDLESERAELKKENDRLSKKILALEEEKTRIKNDLDKEHQENFRHHKKLLAIKKLISKSLGSYKNLLDIVKDIKRELADCESN